MTTELEEYELKLQQLTTERDAALREAEIWKAADIRHQARLAEERDTALASLAQAREALFDVADRMNCWCTDEWVEEGLKRGGPHTDYCLAAQAALSSPAPKETTNE